MSLVKDLDSFIRNSEQHVFIEAEGKPDTISNFISSYNGQYKPAISVNTDGIIQLQPDANKWGLELRLYLHTKTGVPAGLTVTHNDAYRGNYSYRINDVDVIRGLFELGYRIGLN